MRVALLQIICNCSLFLVLASCSHVTYYAGFTTPKNDISNIPKILSSIYFQSPKLTTLRICEYDENNYMVLLYTRSTNSKAKIIQEGELPGRFHFFSQMQQQQILNNQVEYKGEKDIKYVQYFPTPGEGELVTFYQMFQLVNTIKKNKSIELYSQTGGNLKRSFTIIYNKGAVKL